MNSIVKKVMLVLAIVFGLYTVLLCAFGRFVITPSFDHLQEAAATEEVGRCRLILNKEIAIVKSLCMDWATWDDSCKFIVDRNEEFIKSNLELAALKSSKINSVIYMDFRGNIVWGKTYDFDTGQELNVPQFSQEQILKTPLFYSHNTVDSVSSGLILVNDRPVIVCTSRIINSKKDGPVMGAILMARFLDDDDIRDMAASLGTDFRLAPTSKADLIPASGQNQAIQQDGRDRIRIAQVVNDIFGDPAMTLIVRTPTPISAKGRMVGLFISVSLIVAGVITLVVTFLLLKTIVMRRIETLGRVIEQVASQDQDMDDQEKPKATDEIGKHTEMVMKMLGRLDWTEHALTASYQRFRTAFFNAPFPIVIHDDSGKILQLNRKWTELTGYVMGDIPTIDDWCGKAAQDPKELREALRISAGQQNCGDEPIDYAHKTKDGRLLTWSFSSSSLGKSEQGRMQTISMAVDMTERQKAQQRLQENESLFRSLTESIPAVSYLAEVTPDAFFIYVSPQVLHFFGYKPEDIRNSGDPWRLIISPDDYRRIMDERFATVSQRSHFVTDYHARARDGEMLLVHEEAQLVVTAKGPMIQGVIFDISDNRRNDIKLASEHVN